MRYQHVLQSHVHLRLQLYGRFFPLASVCTLVFVFWVELYPHTEINRMSPLWIMCERRQFQSCVPLQTHMRESDTLVVLAIASLAMCRWSKAEIETARGLVGCESFASIVRMYALSKRCSLSLQAWSQALTSRAYPSYAAAHLVPPAHLLWQLHSSVPFIIHSIYYPNSCLKAKAAWIRNGRRWKVASPKFGHAGWCCHADMVHKLPPTPQAPVWEISRKAARKLPWVWRQPSL